MKHSGIEWIGEIPKEWNISKLKQLGIYINGYAFKPEDWTDSGKPIIRIQDLTGSFTNPNYYNGTIDNRYLITKGDILVSWAATLDAFIWEKEDGWLNQHIFKAVPDSSMNTRYFFWLIKVAMDNMNNDNKHGIVMQHVTIGLFGNFIVGVPPLSEQQKIANYLDKVCGEVDEMIALQEQMIEELKAYKQSVITEAVTKGLNPDFPMKDSGIDWIGKIPVNWNVKRLKYVSTISRGLFNHRPRNDERYYGGNYPFIQTGDVARANKYIESYSQTLSDLGIAVSKLFPKGTLTMTIAANVGDVSILGFDAYFPDSVLGIVPYSDINNMYLYYVLKAMKTELENAAIISTQLNLNVERVYNMETTIPPLSEQQFIASYLDEKCAEIDALISIKQEKIEELKDYKKSVIYEYVTGKKEVV